MTELSIIGPNITVASPKSVNATACRIANAIANACAVSTIICYLFFILLIFSFFFFPDFPPLVSCVLMNAATDQNDATGSKMQRCNGINAANR
jgi:hypothetical protein